MHSASMTTDGVSLPSWLPTPARHYLIHTEAGLSIRALARATGLHASTVMRQIRRTEARRDDPLIDEGLRLIGRAHFRPLQGPRPRQDHGKDIGAMKHASLSTPASGDTPTEDTIWPVVGISEAEETGEAGELSMSSIEYEPPEKIA